MDQLRTLILQEMPRLRRFSYSLTGSEADAEDLLQNLVVRLLSTGAPDNGEHLPWMLRVCKNIWIDELRYRGVRVKAANDDRLIPYNSEASADSSQRRLDAQKLLEAIAVLPKNQRLALSLVAIESLSYAQAAEVMEVPIGTVMSRVSRARSNLLEHFQCGIEGFA